jgi:hypothetical protein
VDISTAGRAGPLGEVGVEALALAVELLLPAEEDEVWIFWRPMISASVYLKTSESPHLVEPLRKEPLPQLNILAVPLGFTICIRAGQRVVR